MDPINEQEVVDAMNQSMAASARYRKDKKVGDALEAINAKLDVILARMGNTVKSTKAKVE